MHVNQSKPDIKEGIKFKTSRLKETIDFFHQMGLDPISKVTAHRLSYELGKIDFDIDEFPKIPTKGKYLCKNIPKKIIITKKYGMKY